VPLYEYYCPVCDEKFELLRPMSRSDEPAKCSRGHLASRVVSGFSSFTKGADGSTASCSPGFPAST
jgi:putative FmdB family regulatory protein